MNKIRKDTWTTVNLLEDEYAELTVLAEQHDVSLSRIARQMTVEFLERYGKGEAQLPLKFPATNG